MASIASMRVGSPRDSQIFAALDRCPLTVQQLLKLSRTFERPFTNAVRLRERMQQLVAAGRVCRWHYATAGRGSLNYYTLSREGYRILHGDEAILPHPRRFGPVGFSRQAHTRALADFLVHTIVAAHESGVAFTGFLRENELRLEIPGQSLYPDAAFQLVPPGGSPLTFYVEIDNATEPVTCPRDIGTWNREARECWERKTRVYEALYELKRERFRVLAVTTRGELRTTHILETAARLVHYQRRCVVYGVTLREYVENPNPILTPCFCNHRGESVSLVQQVRGKPTFAVRTAVALCYAPAPAGSRSLRDGGAPSCAPQLSPPSPRSAVASSLER